MRHEAPGALVAASFAVVPVACPGCGIEDIALCGDCAALWWEEPFRSEDGAPRLDLSGRPPLPVWSVSPLTGPAHLVIRAWKDGRRRDLDPFFAEAARRAAVSIATAVAGVDAVVPVPARAHSVRSRGVDLTGLLAQAVADGLASSGVQAGVRPLLVHRGVESRRLAARERQRNADALRLRPGVVAASEALLVDDVVTTGSSLARAMAVLEEAGVAAVGALTLAATPPAGLRSQR